MSNQSIKEALETVTAVTVETATQFNVLDVFSATELEALQSLTSVRMKPVEIETLEKAYPRASGAELFIIYKMKELARNEIVASEWRKFGGEWKNQATSLSRQLGSTEEPIRKYAEHELNKLGAKIPLDYHEATIKHVVVKLDKGSQDERIVTLTKIFKNA